MREALSAVLPDDLQAKIRQVLKVACERGLTFATAESCTGGLLASVLTDVDGYGKAFDRGFVVYTDDAKHELLGVPWDLLGLAGAVSKEAAVAMAEGALGRSSADVAMAITGFAGPAGPDDPPGLVHFAVACRGAPGAHCERQFGVTGRGAVRLAALEAAVDMLAQAVDGLAARETDRPG